MKLKHISEIIYPNKHILGGIEINFEPKEEVFSIFLQSFPPNDFIKLLNYIIDNQSFVGNFKGVFFYDDLDEEDWANKDIFAPDEVKIYHTDFGDKILKKGFFIEGIYAYGQAVLEYKASELGGDAIEELNRLLQKLEENYS